MRSMHAFVRTAALALAAGLSASAAPVAAAPQRHAPANFQKAVLAGGCFWGMELVFENVKGVDHVVSGFDGGAAATAHYEEVSTGSTGHAESVEITFDPKVVSYQTLLQVYFMVAHDPTELNRQGPDSGTQYRSAIFYNSPQQKAAALAFIAKLTADKAFSSPIVTQVVPDRGFYAAEEYHQHFAERNPDYPYIVYNDRPKLEVLRQKYPQLVKSQA